MSNENENVMPTNPLSDESILVNFFKPNPSSSSKSARPQTRKVKKPAEKPEHYKICCISLYTEDIENLEQMVKELKGRGYTKANKSQLIRYALATVDLDSMPKQF